MISERLRGKSYLYLRTHDKCIELIELIQYAERRLAQVQESTFYSVFNCEFKRQHKIEITTKAIERLIERYNKLINKLK